MIELSKLNGDSIYINERWIEYVESLPDTTITLNSGNKILVLEPIQSVMDKIISWQGLIHAACQVRKKKPSGKARRQ